MNANNRFLFLFLILIFSANSFSQSDPKPWQVDFDNERYFIENKGQFDGRNWQIENKIQFALDLNKSDIFFTNKGLTYRLDKIIRNPNRNKAIIEDADKHKRVNISELIHVTWLGANPNPEIIAEDITKEYFSYAIKDFKTKEVRNENHLKGYKKITYKNLYDHVDVEYIFSLKTGLKYSIILHPGADVSKIKMKYSSGHTKVDNEKIKYGLNENGEMKITTSLGQITELKPYTFYKGSKQEINSNFEFNNNILSFNLGSFDHSKEIIIDPWVVSSVFTTSTAVWEVETDGVGNVYVIGGETPMQLKKYSIAGALQWTYTTPWDTNNVWLGTLATDNTGISYITSGTSPEIEKIDNIGGMAWHTNGSGFSDEYWSITFNCDKSRLIVGGTILNMIAFQAKAAIFNMDLNNGSVLSTQILATTSIAGIGAFPVEVRSISSSKDAKYVFLTHKQVGAINQNIGMCPTNAPIFQVDNGNHLGYKCENYLPATQNGGGLKALIANDQFLYTHTGNQVHKWMLGDGTYVNSVNLSGGVSTTLPPIAGGGKVVENSGLAVDNCGNVYAGSGDRVVKYDANLNFISEALLPFSVYDVSVNSNGEVLAVGAQFDNQSVNRNGKIQSVNLSACPQFALVCCDANICIPDTFCQNDLPSNLIPSTPGGTWSGPGITNAATGTFDPSVAGAGIHTIIYTLPCGMDSVHIVVSSCVALTACQESNGDVTVSSGVGPYAWQYYAPASSTPITNQAECEACGLSWIGFPLNQCGIADVTTCNTPASWVSFGTGTTVTPPAFPVIVTDAVGSSLTINTLASLPMCSSCPTLTITAANIVDASCSSSNGSFSVSTSGGSSPYDYTIFDGSSNVIGTYNNIAGSQSVTNLVAGAYTVYVVDDNGCTGTQTVTIANAGTVLTPSITGAISFCTGGSTILDAGAGYTSYIWSTTANTQTITVTTAGTYSVTVTNASGCTGSTSVNVTVSSSLTPTVTGNDFCSGSNTTLDAGSGYTNYNWSSPGSVSQTMVVNSAGTYTVTVTNASGCTGTGQITVAVNPNPTPTITGTLSFCNGLSSTLDAGAGYAFYNWSTSASTQTITVSSGGNYSVTVTDNNGCTGSNQVTVIVNPGLSPTISGATSFCTGGSSTLDAGSGYAAYIWSTGAMAQTINVTTAGNYSVTVADAVGCTGTASVVVTVNSSLLPNVTGNNLCSGNSSVIDAGSGYLTYNWSTGDNTQTITVFAANTYSVTVTDATGCSGTGQISINQYPNPSTTITGLLSFCTGFSTTLDAGASFASYAWSNFQNTQSISVNTAGNYSVTVTDANGCTASDQVTVTLNSNLTPIISGNLQICNGASTTLNAGAGYATYLWSNGLNTQSITISSGGNYSVTVSDASGCTGTVSTTVSLNSNPTPVISGSLSMCSGDATLLDAGSGYSAYNWTGSINTQTLNVISSGLYTVTVTNSSGCTGTASATVIESNGVLLSATPSYTVCNGQWAYLTATATGGVAPFTYFWNNVQSAASIGFQPVSTTTYQAYAIDNNGCTSNVVNVTVSVTPPLQVDVVGTPTSICPGDTVQLDVSINQGGGPPYTVYTSDGTVIIPPYFITPTNSGLQWLYVQDGCGAIAHDSILIAVNSVPQANFVSDTTSGCEPLTVAFNPMNPQQGQTYFWNFGDGSYNQLSYDMNPVHSFAQDGIYSVSLTVTNSSGCSYTYTHNQMINVYPNPYASFIAEPTSVSIIKPQIHFMNLSEGATSYVWSFGDNDSSSIESPWHWYSSLGAYMVQLVAISDLGCTDTVSSTIVIRDEYTFYAPTYISPDYDDLNDVFFVIGNGISTKDFHMYIYDRWGEIIYETDKYDPDQPQKYGWDGSAMGRDIVPTGTYTWLVKYYDGDHIAHVRSGPVNVVR